MAETRPYYGNYWIDDHGYRHYSSGSYWIDEYGHRHYYSRYYPYGGTTPPAKRMGEEAGKQVTVNSAEIEATDAEKQLSLLQHDLAGIEAKITEIQSRVSLLQRR